jgi:class 3 adenylate cyclase/tetratricopeptide (TPR) repeat protein
MRCSSCGTELRPSARFCDACGHPVADRHGTRDRRTDTPPRHLAEKILASRRALEGERKQVTVLFADVKGSMELAEQVDPEAWHRVLDRFFTILADGVHRFEGTINQFTGDGIMALFGAPLAHEDHARRACHAALYLSEEIRRYARALRLEQGLNFSVRMGLNSGEVVVGAIGDDLRMDYTALGATVGLAQRMEQLAEPGKVYVTEPTARLVWGFFRLEELGRFSVKGVREAVRVYELGGVGPLRTPLERSRARGFSRFVGREDESATLEAALGRAAAGSAQVVAVVADAGVGKSRLCHEFATRARARGIAVHAGYCVPHGKMLPFLPIRELLRDYFGLGDADGEEEARRKIAGTVLLVAPELTAALPLLFDFLGVPDRERPVPRMDPEARQQRLSTLFTQLVHTRSRREPIVVLLEDLHWIDDGSERFLEALVETLPGTRTLVVANFRPEYRPAWLEQPYCRELPLLPLGPQAVAALLADLLGGDPSLAGLADRIRARTAGNAFFIEEMVQALVEAGSLSGAKGAYRLVRPLAELAVPPTVQAILAARIDRLPEREKEVLQTAAVIGKEFAEPVLRRVSDLPAAEVGEALQALVAAEFVYEDHPGGEYTFKHPLTHEVAYRSQLGERRARVHGAVARAIGELFPDRLGEHAALLAHHWEEASEPLEAASWTWRAAEWASGRDLAEAARQWRKVRSILTAVPETRETMKMATWARIRLLNSGWRLGMSEEEAAMLFTEGMELTRRAGDTHGPAGLLYNYAMIRGMGGAVTEALERAAEAVRLADQTTDAELQLACRVALIEAQWMVGRFRTIPATIEEALERTAEGERAAGETGFNPSRWYHIWLVMMRGAALFQTGHPHDGARDLERALKLARDQHEDELWGWAHEMSVYPAEFRGDAGTALEHARQAVEIAERISSPLSRASAYYALGCAHIVGADGEQAATALEHGLSIVRQRRTGLHWEALFLAQLAEAQLQRGEGARARASVEEAVRSARGRSTRAIECRAELARARVLLRTEGVASRSVIEAALAQARALVEETGGTIHAPFIHVELASLARLTGDEGGRQRELREAHRLFTAMGAPARADRIAAEIASAAPH